jgi:hypothetical protein
MTPTTSFDHLKTTYFDECAELLEAAYGHLAAIAEGRADDDTERARKSPWVSKMN